jgi:hypothetical protein
MRPAPRRQGDFIVSMLTFAGLLAGIFFLTPVRATDAAASPHFTLIPPGPVTDKIRVEARLAVPNAAETAQKFRLSFYWDKTDAAHRIDRQDVTAPPHGFAFARAWWPTEGRAGRRKLIYRIESEGKRRQGSYPFTVVASKTRALPCLQAAWLDPGGLTAYARDRAVNAQDVHDMLDAMHRLGMNIVIVTYVEYLGHIYYPSRLTFYDRDVKQTSQSGALSFDLMETVLSEADKNRMHVFLGVGRGGDTSLLWQFDAPNWNQRNETVLALGRRVVRELWERYGHHPSLYGWYLTHEMDDLAHASAYYNPMADFCHSLSPDRPVLVAPAGTPVLDKTVLERSHVDIFAYQDAVGSGYIPYQNTYAPEKRMAMLETIYQQYKAWHDGTDKHLWSDLEIWEMDGTHGYSHAYPSSFARVRRQIQIESKYVEMLTGYEYSGFLEAPESKVHLKDRRAAQLYTDYTAYLKASGFAPQ